MNSKAQELELRNIMEGLEEFATFMSYQSDYQGLRILSVETVEQAKLYDDQPHSAQIIPFKKPSSPSEEPDGEGSQLHKELKFYDQKVH